MKAIMDGLLVLPHELVTGQVILYDENIEAIVPRKEFRAGMVTDLIDAEGLIVSPGFINEHIHGCGGFDTMDEYGQALEEMSRLLPSAGVTAFAPTTMTYGRERLEGTLQRIRQAAAQAGGAQILGAHMEGPYISQAYKGAQKGDAIGEADFSWLEPYADVIKIITLAPETLGRSSFLEQCRQQGIVVSIGHSGADYDQARYVMEEYGPCQVTHFFNAMTPFHQRRPGIIGAAFDDPAVRCELICDNLHVHPSAQRLVYRQKGRAGIILVTDSLRAALLGDGPSELGGQAVLVQNGEARLSDGTLAGSVLTMEQAVLNFLVNTQASLPDVIAMATENPAKALGVFDRMGSLEVGKQADITIFDDNMNIKTTLVKGRAVYQ